MMTLFKCSSFLKLIKHLEVIWIQSLHKDLYDHLITSLQKCNNMCKSSSKWIESDSVYITLWLLWKFGLLLQTNWIYPTRFEWMGKLMFFSYRSMGCVLIFVPADLLCLLASAQEGNTVKTLAKDYVIIKQSSGDYI